MRALLIAAVQVLALGSIALSKSQPVALKSAQLVDSSHGWAANEHQVFWTADAGAHWKDITPPNSSRAQISSVFFLDNFAGWVFSAVPGSDPNGEPDFQIAFSDNAGSTWNSERLLRSRLVPNWQNVGSDADIDFVDRRHGWMDLSLVGSPAVAPGILLRTSDGGKSWTPVPTAPHIRGKVRFIDEQNGWLAGGADNEHLFATHDGGKTWKNIALKPPADVNPSSYGQYAPPVFVSARHGYLPVTYSTPGIDHSTLVTFHTVDSGNTWTAKGVVPNAGQSQIEAPTAIVDSTIITASTYRQNDSARVTKLGATGLPVESTVPLERVKGAVVSHLSFATESQGWMLTSHGLLATKDGGATWIDITPQQEPKRLPNAKGDQRSLVTTSPTYRQSVFLPGGFGRLPQTEHRNLMRSRTSSSSASTLASSFQFGTADSVHIGFDRCVLPEPDQMSVWWQESPYFDVGVYLGGDSMHCAVTATKGRVTEIRSQGWGGCSVVGWFTSALHGVRKSVPLRHNSC